LSTKAITNLDNASELEDLEDLERSDGEEAIENETKEKKKSQKVTRPSLKDAISNARGLIGKTGSHARVEDKKGRSESAAGMLTCVSSLLNTC